MLVVAENESRVNLLVQNFGAVDVYIGGSNVTANTGILIPAKYTNADTGQREISYWEGDSSTDALYAITAASTADLRVREVTAD